MACLLEISFQLLRGKRKEFSQSMTMFSDGKDQGDNTGIVYEDRDDPDHLLWVQEWAERVMLERHLETDQFKTLMGALRTLAAVHDIRIVELGLGQRSTQLTDNRPRELKGRRMSHCPE